MSGCFVTGEGARARRVVRVVLCGQRVAMQAGGAGGDSDLRGEEQGASAVTRHLGTAAGVNAERSGAGEEQRRRQDSLHRARAELERFGLS